MIQADKRLDQAGTAHREGRLDEARTLYEAILTTQPDHPVALHNLGVLVLQGGDPKGAVAHLRRLCTVAPRHPRHWQALAQAMAAAGQGEKLKALAGEAGRHGIRLALPRQAAQGPATPAGVGDPMPRLKRIAALLDAERFTEALRESEALIARAPRLAQAHNLKALALKSLNRVEEAITALKTAVGLDPRFPDAFSNLGNCHRLLGDDLAALGAYDKALRLRPDFVGALNNKGNALARLGRAEEAEAAYREAVRRAPDYAEAWNGLGNLLRDLGRSEEAEEHFRKAMAIKPRSAVFASHLAQNRTFSDPRDPDIALLEDLSRRPGLAADERARLLYALGKVRHDLADAGQGDYAQAFAAYAEGAAVYRATLTYDVADDENLMAELAEALPEAVPPGMVPDHPRPIHIVGMPRSGTSLVEQIIASHPAVHGAGELSLLPRVIKAHRVAAGCRVPWDWARQLEAAEGAGFARTLLDGLEALVPAGKSHITDKAPNNFLFAGIIARTVPGARIVHIHRHPMDVGLSCFIHMFVGGAQAYSYDLTDLGRFIRGYRRLVAHWRAVLPEQVFIDLPYDDLVAEPEPTIRGLVERLGLPWDDACLSHHETRRVVQTPSSAQVREPVHGRRRGRWRCFEKELEPLRRALEGED